MTTPAPAYRHAAALAWLFAQADREGLPAPDYVRFGNIDWDHCASIRLTFDSYDDLTAWADRAGVAVSEAIGIEGELLGYDFEGAINEVRIEGAFFIDDEQAPR